MRLSIVFVTMNRSSQLLQAIQSCVESDIPSNTQFVIIDNGSIDNTAGVIEQCRKEFASYVFDYFKMEQNLGISEGRNEGKRHAEGQYLYYMDDDAVISKESKNNFFSSSLMMLDQDKRMGTLTTEVYDETLKMWRESRRSRCFSEEKPEVQVFHGNSYFIRNNIPGLFYIPSIKYAYEDLFLSILVKDKGYYNGINEKVYIVHKPNTNKWVPGSQSLFDIYIKANAAQLTIKTLLYPIYFKPIVFIGFFARCYKTTRFKNHIIRDSYDLYKEQIKGIKINRISCKTLKDLIKTFGFIETM